MHPLDDPYTSPNTDTCGTSVSGARTLSVLAMSAGAGIVAAALVYVGDVMQWPNFNRRAGYVGTDFIGDLLYAINDPYAIHIVAILWFCYGALFIAMIAIVGRRMGHRR
jgi:hypothetical protein